MSIFSCGGVPLSAEAEWRWGGRESESESEYESESFSMCEESKMHLTKPYQGAHHDYYVCPSTGT